MKLLLATLALSATLLCAQGPLIDNGPAPLPNLLVGKAPKEKVEVTVSKLAERLSNLEKLVAEQQESLESADANFTELEKVLGAYSRYIREFMKQIDNIQRRLSVLEQEKRLIKAE